MDDRAKQEQIALGRAQLLRVSYTDTRQLTDAPLLLDTLSLQTMDDYKVVPLRSNTREIEIGFTEKTPQSSLKEISNQLNQFSVGFSFISMAGWKELYGRYYAEAHKNDPKPPSADEVARQLADNILETNQQLLESGKLDLFESELAGTNQTNLFEFIAQQAYLLDASDIHVEPARDNARLRFRIDGRLLVVGTLNQDRYQTLLNEMQKRGGIRWNADYPQTGSLKLSLYDRSKQQIDVNMRIETIPTIHGTDAVLRIFNMEQKFLRIDNLGLNSHQQETLEGLITHPHGMVLVVGPTGSGKTSTQYAIINGLNTTEVKIVTLEDPVEYEIDGVTQIPVKSSDQELFMEKLRAILREDPDIIMLGEVRDTDTAKTALQASLTGHLVLSTFHAGNSSSAISRLLDMIGRNPLLASAIRMVMAQRLIRKLCGNCKQTYQPDGKVLQLVRERLKDLPDSIRPNLENPTFYKPVGCDECHHIGYVGRMVILEQLVITDTLENLITSNPDQLTANMIHRQAVSEGMVTLVQDGLLKVASGLTSLDEVFRAVEI